MICAIIPVKAGHESKGRLAHLLSAEERAELIRSFLRRTLAVLNQVPAVERTLVVSPDPAVLAVARRYGASTLFEEGVPGLNTAVTRAVGVATAARATAALILPADLPFIQIEDVAMMLAAGGVMNGHGRNGGSGRPPMMVICPDSDNQGTNALLISLPADFVFQYGPGSFHRHCQEADRLGFSSQVVHSPGLTFDLDTEEDWRIYRATVKLPGYPIT